MHLIEPFYNWRGLYIASDDEGSPFYGREYNEFEFQDTVYNFYIHPQWDPIGSPTLFIKILYVDYENGYAIMEMIGEWNDAIENDIMTFKRDLIDEMLLLEIDKFIVIGENVLNFHGSDDCYYEEWFDEIEEGWIAFVNFHEHVRLEMQHVGIDHYVLMGGEMEELDWRTYLPNQLYNKVKGIIAKRLD